ncbi:MAG TPA: ornithine carbamoyltransferase [Firmicutes bacterium]|nr:ornithine carbamoyltransferase [Bacillota bacterium]
MAVNLKGRDVVSLADLTAEEIRQIINTGAHLKMCAQTGTETRPLTGKTLGMIFHKPSTRTRVSFEVAMVQLGGHALYLSASELQLRRGETIADTGRVLSRYLDAIMIRTYSHADVVELAEAASIPVINALTDFSHPCQGLGDLLTIHEKKGRLEGVKLAYVGDGNNVAHSLMFGGARMGMHVSVGTPPGYEPDQKVVELAQEFARASGGKVEVVNDAGQTVRGADVVYTDVWASMGQEAEEKERQRIFMPFQVNQALMAQAGPQAIFMHCLPAHRGQEVTDEVIDGPQSVVWDQAENRLHIQKAILALVIAG